jgi:hypothetical protein
MIPGMPEVLHSSPARCLMVSAEAVKAAACAAGHGGYSTPADVYDALGALQLAVERLPQTLQQMDAWLHAEARAGRVGHDEHWPVSSELAALSGYLRDACQDLGLLGRDLNSARSVAAHLTGH